MVQIKSVSPIQNGKFIGALYGIVTIPFAAVFLLMGLAKGELLALLLILLPVVYGLAGFLGGAAISLLYNFTANLVGGIEIELADPPNRSAE